MTKNPDSKHGVIDEILIGLESEKSGTFTKDQVNVAIKKISNHNALKIDAELAQHVHE